MAQVGPVRRGGADAEGGSLVTGNDRRLIEAFLPIEEISAESFQRKVSPKGPTLHLWRARRP